MMWINDRIWLTGFWLAGTKGNLSQRIHYLSWNCKWEVLIHCNAVKTMVFWDAIPCSLVDGYQPVACIFKAEKCKVEEGSTFHQNIGNYQLEYMASHTRRIALIFILCMFTMFDGVLLHAAFYGRKIHWRKGKMICSKYFLDLTRPIARQRHRSKQLYNSRR